MKDVSEIQIFGGMFIKYVIEIGTPSVGRVNFNFSAIKLQSLFEGFRKKIDFFLLVPGIFFLMYSLDNL